MKEGEYLGRYSVTKPIGQGGMGRVYLATDAALERSVVIKTFQFSDRPPEERASLGRRFASEARAVARLHHPCIVTIYDVGQQDDVAFIVMEYMDGGSLATRLHHEGALAATTAAGLIQSVADALDYAHGAGIIHRDVKPANILFDKAGRPKLADFGVAKIVELDQTSAGSFLGTPAYISPEQITGEAVTAASDQWSLGIVAFELLTGRRPFEANTIPEALHRILQTDLLENDRSLSPAVSSVLKRALSRKTSGRFDTCAQFARALSDAIDTSDAVTAIPLTSSYAPPPPPTPRPPSSVVVSGITMTRMEERPLPDGITATQIFPAATTGFFSSSTDRYDEIKGSLKFFRDGLQREYEDLSAQARLTYKLWVACVTLGFLMLVAGVGLLFANRLAQGVVTTASTVLLYFIQKVFQQREDHYRAAAAQKHSNLEYGNQWLLVIQSIDAMDDSKERSARQARLVDALTDRLKATRNRPGVPATAPGGAAIH